jgi:glycosyltransferase involved in cell wall biosynthesis
MRIAVVNSWAPFLKGGAEYLATALTQKLAEYGHSAILVRLPFSWNPPERILEHILACRCVRLHNVDRVIGLKFPAYFVPHDNKVAWLLHQFRQAYDLWGTSLQDLPDSPAGRSVRDAIVQSDNAYLPECRAIYVNSQVTADRLRKFNNIGSTVLYPPLLEPSRLIAGEYGDYVFLPGRITLAKRQHLALEAMRHVRSKVRMVIAGPPETPRDVERLEEIAARFALHGRIEIIPRFISEEEKSALFAGALACVYIPHDEDSYGYVTLEAAQSSKPTITCSDSGGIKILVLAGRTGLVTEPEPEALAEAMDQLYEHRDRARQLGLAAHDHMKTLKIEWGHVIQQLTS